MATLDNLGEFATLQVFKLISRDRIYGSLGTVLYFAVHHLTGIRLADSSKLVHDTRAIFAVAGVGWTGARDRLQLFGMAIPHDGENFARCH